MSDRKIKLTERTKEQKDYVRPITPCPCVTERGCQDGVISSQYLAPGMYSNSPCPCKCHKLEERDGNS